MLYSILKNICLFSIQFEYKHIKFLFFKMLRKMKLVILATLLCSIFTSHLKASSKSHFNEQSKDFVDFYYVFDDWYYSYTPVVYTYTPTSYYYLCEWWWFPSACGTSYVIYRKNELKNNKENKENTPTTQTIEKREMNLDDTIKQIKQLKKEIFGKEDFSTEDIRKNNKAYDPRWLLAQLKISRILFLEDEVRNKKVDNTIAIEQKKNEAEKAERKDTIKIEKKEK